MILLAEWLHVMSVSVRHERGLKGGLGRGSHVCISFFGQVYVTRLFRVVGAARRVVQLCAASQKWLP